MTEMLSDMTEEFTQGSLSSEISTPRQEMPLTWQVLYLLSSQQSLHLQPLAPNTSTLPHPECILGWQTDTKDRTLSLSLTSPSLGQEFEPSLTASHWKKNKTVPTTFLLDLQCSAHTDSGKLPLLRITSCGAPRAGQGSTGHMSYQWQAHWRGHCNGSANANLTAHLQKWHSTHWPFMLQFSTKLHFLGKLIWKAAISAITQ